MKKIKILACILAIFILSACQQKEKISDAERTVEMSVTASISGRPDSYPATKGENTEAFSHLGGAMNVDQDAYDLRYIIEVWTKEDTPRLAYRAVESIDKDFLDTPVTFNLRLQAMEYYFVFWADFVEQGKLSDLHYTTDINLQNIRYTDIITSIGDLASDEMDAYCAVEVVDLGTGDWDKSIVLQRPFGKLRFVATDMVDGGESEDLQPKVATIQFKDIQIINSYNALTRRASSTGELRTNVEFDFDAVREDVIAGDTKYEGAYLLGYDYFFVADQNPSYKMDITVYADKEKTTELGKKSISGIPVSVNKLTTVIGNFYSNEVSVNVIVDDNFDNDETTETIMKL